MIENRLCLNKKNKYELPDNTRIQVYQSSKKVKRLNITPSFEPDICLKGWGNVWQVEEREKSNYQIWIKSDNKDLLRFIMKYKIRKRGVSALSINVHQIKKIILEEFYNKRGCDIEEEDYR